MSEIAEDRMIPMEASAQEKTLLGAILLDPSVLSQCTELKADHFKQPYHRTIYATIIAMSNAGRGIDIVTVSEELNKSHDLENVGGVAYLSSTMDGVPHLPCVEEYVKIIRGKAEARYAVDVYSGAIAKLMDGKDVAEVTGSVAIQTMRLGENAKIQTNEEVVKNLYKRVNDVYTGKQKTLGLPTGVHGMDFVTTGYREAEFTIIAGYPGTGKTAYMFWNALTIAKTGKRVGIIELEVSHENCIARLACAHSGIHKDVFRDPRGFNMEKVTSALNAGFHVAELPITISAAQSPRYDAVISRTKQLASQCDIVYIDHVHRIEFDRKRDLRLEIGSAAVGFANVAKQTGVPIVLLSHLTRPDGRSYNDRPTIFQLRESGALEGEADNVFMLYTPMDAGTGKFLGEDEIIVGKQREGATLSVPIFFERHTGMFRDRTKEGFRIPETKPQESLFGSAEEK